MYDFLALTTAVTKAIDLLKKYNEEKKETNNQELRKVIADFSVAIGEIRTEFEGVKRQHFHFEDEIAKLKAEHAAAKSQIEKACRDEIAKLDGSNLKPEELDALKALRAIGDCQSAGNIHQHSATTVGIERFTVMLDWLANSGYLAEVRDGYRLTPKAVSVLYHSAD